MKMFPMTSVEVTAGARVMVVAACAAVTGCESVVLSEGGSCAVQMEQYAELRGAEVELGVLEDLGTRIVLGVRGELREFDARGRYTGLLMREGGGPGEATDIVDLVQLDDELLAVLEPARLSLLHLGSGSAESYALPVLPHRSGSVALPDGTIVVAGRMNVRGVTDTAYLYSPLVRITRRGRVIGYIGKDERELEEPLKGMVIGRLPAFDEEAGLTTVKRVKYQIERWDTVGGRREEWRPPNAWFRWPPNQSREDVRRHVVNEPEVLMQAAQFDSAGRLLLLARVEGKNWQKGVADGVVVDPEEWTDSRIEVVDPLSREVLCHAVIESRLIGYTGPGRVATYTTAASGEPVISMWRISVNSEPN